MRTIVHTTDLVHDDRAAFEHSVALAVAGRAQLVSLHANAPESAAARMPDAAPLLSTWGRRVDEVAFSKQVHECCDDPVETVLDAIGRLAPDLIVAATHQRSALARVFMGSGAEAIAHNAHAPVLLLPPDARGFVSRTDGSIDLRRVLVPVGDADEAAAAIQAATQLLEIAGVERTQLTLLHVGGSVPTPTPFLDRHAGWSVARRNVAKGGIERAIVEEAETSNAVVMATRGHDSVGDVLLGSHTDRVLHRTRTPILSARV